MQSCLLNTAEFPIFLTYKFEQRLKTTPNTKQISTTYVTIDIPAKSTGLM